MVDRRHTLNMYRKNSHLTYPHPSISREDYLMSVGWGRSTGETIIQSSKKGGGLTTVPLKVLANVSETRVSVSPGPLMWSGSIKTLFSSKPNLTLASRALLCRWNRREFRSRWALLQTRGLAEMHHNSPLPDLLLHHWPAAANPSTGSVVVLGPRPLPELL